MGIVNTGAPSNKTSTSLVFQGPASLIGFYVNSTTGGTIVLYDSTTNTNAISGTITPAIGWHAFPAEVATGIYVVIANTLNVTLVYRPH